MESAIYRHPEGVLEDNLRQTIESPARWNVLLDLMVINTSELIGDVKIGDSLGCSGHALVEVAVLRKMSDLKSKVKTWKLSSCSRS